MEGPPRGVDRNGSHSNSHSDSTPPLTPRERGVDVTCSHDPPPLPGLRAPL